MSIPSPKRSIRPSTGTLRKVIGAAFWLSMPALVLLGLWLSYKMIMGALYSETSVYRWLCRLLVSAYATWYWKDRKTPYNGVGRRSERLITFLEPVLQCARDYFPASLLVAFDYETTKELIADRPKMLGCHPHGIWSLGALSNLLISGGYRLPGDCHPVVLLTLNLHFQVPLWREFCIAMGLASVDRQSVQEQLGRQGAVAIIVGGAREALYARPGLIELLIRQRRGFFRLALRHGVALFPVLTLGETQLYRQLHLPALKRLQFALLHLMSFSFPLFCGRFGILPAPLPLITIIGEPLLVKKVGQPTDDEIGTLQEQYVHAMNSLYNKYRHLDPSNVPCKLHIQ